MGRCKRMDTTGQQTATGTHISLAEGVCAAALFPHLREELGPEVWVRDDTPSDAVVESCVRRAGRNGEDQCVGHGLHVV